MSVIINQSGVAVTHDKVLGTDFYGIHVKVPHTKLVLSTTSQYLDSAANCLWERLEQLEKRNLLNHTQVVLIGAIMRGEVK